MLNVLETLIAQDLAEVLVNDSAVPHRIAIEHLEGFAKAKNLVQRFGEGRGVERAMVRSRIVERELLAQNRLTAARNADSGRGSRNGRGGRRRGSRRDAGFRARADAQHHAGGGSGDDMRQGGLLAQRMEGDQVYADKQLVIVRTSSHGELSITGAIDYYNAESVAAVVAGELAAGADPAAELSGAISGNGDLHIDLSHLEFTDVTGIRALVQVAENAGDGRRLVLRGLPSRIRMVMSVVGWGDLPNLVIEEPSAE